MSFCISIIARVLICGVCDGGRSMLKYVGEFGYQSLKKSKYSVLNIDSVNWKFYGLANGFMYEFIAARTNPLA